MHSKCKTNLGELEKFHQLAKDTLVQGYNPQQVQLNFLKNQGFLYKKRALFLIKFKTAVIKNILYLSIWIDS